MTRSPSPLIQKFLQHRSVLSIRVELDLQAVLPDITQYFREVIRQRRVPVGKVNPIHPAMGEVAPSDEAVQLRAPMKIRDDDAYSLANDRPVGKDRKFDPLLAAVDTAPVVPVELRKGILPFGFDVQFLERNPMLIHELLGYFASTAACGRIYGVAHNTFSLILLLFALHLAPVTLGHI